MSTASGKPRPLALSPNALRNLIQAALSRGFFDESEHAEFDHPERNLSTDDILYGLKQSDWVYAKEPDFDTVHNTWEYLIRTKDVEGNELEIKLAAYPDYNRIRIITRW